MHERMVSLVVSNKEVEEIIKRIPYNISIAKKGKNSGESVTLRIKGIRKAYSLYGLDTVKAAKKFIPDDYLFNSIENRIELLRGLMDSDGSVDKLGRCIFCTTSKTLLTNLRFLVKSLGGRIGKGCKVNGCMREFPGNIMRQCKEAYYINFNVPYDIVSRLSKKQNRYAKKPIRSISVQGIEFIGKHSATCISVDSKDQLFVCGNFIPTHNTSSGLAQLIGMATRGIKAVIRNIDLDGIVPCVERHYDYLLDNYDIYGLMGDYKVSAKGTAALVAREQSIVRKNEFLNYTNNPVDIQIIGVENRRKLLFTVAKDLGIDLDESPVAVFDQNPMGQAMPPQPGAATLDQAGNKSQGVEGRTANPTRPRLQVSGPGQAGGAEGYQ